MVNKSENKVNIYRATKLFAYGKIENKQLVLSSKEFAKCFIKESKSRDNIMYDQIKKIKNNPDLCVKDYCFIVNFEDFMKYDKLKKCENGILIKDENGDKLYKDFFKSNSMSKESEIFYVDNSIYDELYTRLTMNMKPSLSDEIELSKWYAYTGLSISDVDLVDITLEEDRVLFVDDYTPRVEMPKTTFITGVSVQYLKEIYETYRGTKDEKIKEIQIKKVACFYRCINQLEELIKRLEKSVTQRAKNEVRFIKDIINTIDDLHSNMVGKVDTIIYDATEIYWAPVIVDDFPLEANCFDGEGLISKEFCQRINRGLGRIEESEQRTSFQIRAPFIKGVVHSVDFKMFCKNNNIKTLTDAFSGKEKNVEDIDIILTKSQFKGIKFLKKDKNQQNNYRNSIKKYFELIKENKFKLGVVLTNPMNRFNTINLSYQFLSTVPAKKGEYEEADVIQDRFIRRFEEICDDDNIELSLGEEDDENYFVNELRVFKANPEFFRITQSYKKMVKKNYESMKKDFVLGGVEVDGGLYFLSGDLLKLLYYVCKMEYPKKLQLAADEFYINDKDKVVGKKCTVLRSPHYLTNEICSMRRNQPKNGDLRQLYFGHLNGVLMINSEKLINTRLGGADYDGDTVIVVKDPVFNRLEEKATVKKYPTIIIPSLEASKTKLTYKSKVECLQSTFNSRVGIISNFAFKEVMNSKLSTNEKIYSLDNPYDETYINQLGIYTIISGLEIDSSKNGKKPYINIVPYYANKVDSSADKFLKAKSSLKNQEGYSEKIIRDYIEEGKIRHGYDDKLKDKKKNKKGKKVDDSELFIDSLLIDTSIAVYDHKMKDENKKAKKKSLYPFKHYRLSDVLLTDDELNRVALLEAYKKVKSTFKNYINSIYDDEKIHKLIDLIMEYLESNPQCASFTFEDILNAFKIKNRPKALEIILEKKFHYAVTDEEKEEILSKAKITIDDISIKDAIMNSEKEGYKLLYLILYYYDATKEHPFKVSHEHDIKIDQNQLVDFNIKYDGHIKAFEKMINDKLKTCSLNDTKKYVNMEFLLEIQKELEFDPIKEFNRFAELVDFTTDTDALKLFNNDLVNYLNKVKEGR